MTTLDTFYKQLSIFSNYQFESNTHTYYFKGEKVDTSVTKIVDIYTKPFDRDYWSLKKAKDQGVTQAAILAQWDAKAETSGTCGTQFHSYMENLISGKIFDPKIEGRDEINTRLDKLIPIGNQFVSDSMHKLLPIKSEFTVGYETRVAGQIDQIFYNIASERIELWDWKTNKLIQDKNHYGSYMLYPFNNFPDCNFYHYSLQLNIYKYLLCIRGIDIGNCYFTWFNENNDTYVIYQCVDMQAQVKQILNIQP